MKRSLCMLIVMASLLITMGSTSAVSQKYNSIKHAAVETDAAEQREHAAEVLLSAVQTAQANIVKLVEAIKDQSGAQLKLDRTNAEPWRWLWWLTALRVQQGLLFVGALYTFFAAWQLFQIRRQANIADRTLIQTLRPWISPIITVISDGLSYDAAGAHIVDAEGWQ